MIMKKINITIPEENLKKINDFCKNENINKSSFIREAAARYISNITRQREEEQKSKDMKWARETMEKLRKKSKGFINSKSSSEIIRKFRDSK